MKKIGYIAYCIIFIFSSLGLFAQSVFAQSTTTIAKKASKVESFYPKNAANNLSVSAVEYLYRSQNRKGSETLSVFLKFESNQALLPGLKAAQALGFKETSVTQTIAIGQIEASKLEKLSNIKGLIHLDIPGQAELSIEKTLDASCVRDIHLGTDPSLENNIGMRGEGVIVGVVDEGYDYTHPAFRDPDDPSKLRIVSIWEQEATDGSNLPLPNANFRHNITYGREYKTQEAILSRAYDKLGYNDGTTHGSHVASIAAGSGLASPTSSNYTGMAPKADLVLVSCGGNITKLMDGIEYIHSYAKSVNKPCAINLSWNTNDDPHDGTSNFDQWLSEKHAKDSEGFIVVGSAGNEGGNKAHLGGKIDVYGTADEEAQRDYAGFMSVVNFANTSKKEAVFHLWDNKIDGAVAVGGGIIKKNAEGGSPKLEIINYSNFVDLSPSRLNYGSQRLTLSYDGTAYAYLTTTIGATTNGKASLKIEVAATTLNNNNNYDVVLVFISKNKNKKAEFHVWNSTRSRAQLSRGIYQDKTFMYPFVESDDEYNVGGLGGISPNILSVGAYNSADGKIAYFSSKGPTADGRIKPDVSTPGYAISGAMSGPYYRFGYRPDGIQNVSYNLDGTPTTVYYCQMSGTSMASPAMCGIAALALQANPTWNVHKLREAIKNSAVEDAQTASLPNNTFGYAKACLSQILANKPQELQSYTSIKDFKVAGIESTGDIEFVGSATVSSVQEKQDSIIFIVQDETAAIMLRTHKNTLEAQTLQIGSSLSYARASFEAENLDFAFLSAAPQLQLNKAELNPETIEIAELKAIEEENIEDYKYKLFKIENLYFEADTATFEYGKSYRVFDPSANSLNIYVDEDIAHSYIGEQTSLDTFAISGILLYKNNEFSLVPRDKDDLLVTSEYKAVSIPESQMETENALLIYPNPSNGSFSIGSQVDIEEVKLYDIQNRLLKSWSEPKATYSIEDLPKSSYILKLKLKNGSYLYQKIISL